MLAAMARNCGVETFPTVKCSVYKLATSLQSDNTIGVDVQRERRVSEASDGAQLSAAVGRK